MSLRTCLCALVLSLLVVGAPASAEDAPEISRSVGTEGGTVLFWPRTIPRSDDPAVTAVASRVQASLRQAIAEARPGSELDVRPMPERVCPKAGCAAATVGALLVHQQGACVVVGLISAPGTAPARLVPWAGLTTLKQPEVPFREPPESHIVVRDFARCDDLVLDPKPIIEALRALGTTPTTAPPVVPPPPG